MSFRKSAVCYLQKRFSSSNDVISPLFTNRNPRNLERLRIGYKPDGYHIEKPGRCFWHKLQLKESGRHATATLTHFENGPVLEASTKEWALKRQLYRNTNISAFMNLGRVFAQRCMEAGLTEMYCDIEPKNKDGKIAAFLAALKDSGLKLEEPPQYKKPVPWELVKPEKPWLISE